MLRPSDLLRFDRQSARLIICGAHEYTRLARRERSTGGPQNRSVLEAARRSGDHHGTRENAPP